MRSSEDFDSFYRARAPRLTAQVYALTGDWSEAQDCVQEAFIRAWQRWSRLQDYDEPGAWVRTVALREAIGRWRRGRRAVRALARLGAVADAPGPNGDAVDLSRALDVLSYDQRLCVVLYHLCDLPVAEISAIAGVPAGTVKARLSRARTALGPLIADEEPDRDEVGRG